MTLGTAIATIRRQHGLSQEQLAERVGMLRNHISHIESDSRTPNLTTLERLARGMDIKAWEILKVAEAA